MHIPNKALSFKNIFLNPSQTVIKRTNSLILKTAKSLKDPTRKKFNQRPVSTRESAQNY